MTKQADLIAYLFEGAPAHARGLSAELLGWMDESARFTSFVETYRDKIRKKIRVTREVEGVLDLRGELVIARSLLADRRLAVAYEPYASTGRRGPDFAVTYRANLVFNIEVARIRTDAQNGAAGVPDAKEAERKALRVERILLDKLGQMQAGMPNLLVIHTRAGVAQAIDLAGLVQGIKARVESKDPAFFAATRYASPAAFYKDFLLLSGILFWGGNVWVNKQARPGLDEKVIRLVGDLNSP